MNKSDLIEKLFSWKHELELVDSSGNKVLTVYQRLLGDADIQKARTIALKYSRIARKLIKDPNSDEYFIHIDIVKDLTKEEIIANILFEQLLDIRAKVDRTFYFPEPEEPDSDASTEALEEYEELENTYEERRIEALKKAIDEEIKNRQAELNTLLEEDLYREFETIKINSYVDQVLRTKFVEASTYLGTYSDAKLRVHLYETFDDFLNTPDLIKNQLTEGYVKLEVSSLNLKELQNPQSGET